LIWIKRLAPFLIIVAAYFAYDWYSARQERTTADDIDRYASVTAEIWIGSAIYRNHPDQFMAYRDSLLSAHGMSAVEIGRFLDQKHQTPEEYLDFVEVVNGKVDSIYKLENLPELDSIVEADTAMVDVLKK
jgi:hypothetical protein